MKARVGREVMTRKPARRINEGGVGERRLCACFSGWVGGREDRVMGVVEADTELDPTSMILL